MFLGGSRRNIERKWVKNAFLQKDLRLEDYFTLQYLQNLQFLQNAKEDSNLFKILQSEVIFQKFEKQ